MQYYPHGSLFDLLKRGRRNEKRAVHELTWTKRCVRGLRHSRASPVADANLAARDFCGGMHKSCVLTVSGRLSLSLVG